MKNKGLTIVELLISTAITIIVLSMAINIYVSIKNNYTQNKDKIENEVKELVVKNTLYDFIKNTGFACKYGTRYQSVTDSTGDSLEAFFLDVDSVRVGNMPLPSGSSIAGALEEECSGELYRLITIIRHYN
jgi:type IV pilus assembly protein PilW